MTTIGSHQAIQHAQNFSLTPSEQKKLGDMNQACSEVTKTVNSIGKGLKALSQNKGAHSEKTLKKQLKIMADLESTVKELGTAVDKMTSSSQRIQPQQIDSVVKFEQKLETTSNEIRELLDTLKPGMDKKNSRRLKSIAKDLKEVSKKCKNSKRELVEIQVSLQKPEVSKKVGSLVKSIHDPYSTGLKDSFQRFVGGVASLWLSPEKICDKVETDLASAVTERAVIQEKLESSQTLTEIAGLLSRLERGREHLNQMVDVISDLSPKDDSETSPGLLQHLDHEVNEYAALEKQAENRKKIIEIKKQVEDLSLHARSLSDYNLVSQFEIKHKLESIEEKIKGMEDLSPADKKLCIQISGSIQTQLYRLDHVLSGVDTNRMKKSFSTFIQRLESDLKITMVWEESQQTRGHWNPERIQNLLTTAQRDLTLLQVASRKYVPVGNEEIGINLNKIKDQISSLSATLAQSLETRSEEVKNIRENLAQSQAAITEVVADKTLNPEQKIVRLHELEIEVRTSRKSLGELRVSSRIPLYASWKTGMEEAKKLIARTQGEVASYEAAIQFPVFRNELKQIKTMQQECLQSPELTVTQKLAKLEALALEVGSIQENCKKVPITESMPEYKELQSLMKEAAKLERALQKDSREIEVDVSGLNFVTRFLVKAKRSIDVMQQLGGALNARTIIKGASKNWDPERLRTGKHEVLRTAGAEHVQLTSSTGCKVDAHYLSAATFMAQLEKLGGERKIFQFGLEQTELLNGQEYVYEIEGEFPVSMREIKLTGDLLERTDYGSLQIQLEISMALGHEILIIEGEAGRFFIIDPSGYERLRKSKALILGELNEQNIIESKRKNFSLSTATPFPGIKFQKSDDTKWKEAVSLLDEMNVKESAWRLVQTKDAVYLVPKEHAGKIQLALRAQKFANGATRLEEKSAKGHVESTERGTVLLTTHETGIYEQNREEILTFALQGVNIMMYNNPGKGLSTGAPDRKNIDASIEAAYQYLKKDKGLPDQKLLAKGQCFGGAPTAWLGQEHPNINVMLDQNPANFYEVAIQKMNTGLEKLATDEKNETIQRLKEKFNNNFFISGVAKAILGGYNVSSNLAHNQGHKLIHVNVAVDGFGGDDLVPSHHPIEMIDAIGSQDKEVTLSMNPGGRHVTPWWVRSESQETVNRFLERTGISQPLF